jgi:hypothetical protein
MICTLHSFDIGSYHHLGIGDHHLCLLLLLVQQLEDDIVKAGAVNLEGDLTTDVGEEAALLKREELRNDVLPGIGRG